jgi:hypothetical protein
MARPSRVSPEARDRAVRMALEHENEPPDLVTRRFTATRPNQL